VISDIVATCGARATVSATDVTRLGSQCTIPFDATIWSLSSGQFMKLWRKLDKESFSVLAHTDFSEQTLRNLGKSTDPDRLLDMLRAMPAEDVVTVVNKLDPDATWKLFSLPMSNAQGFRKATVAFGRSSEISSSAVSEFVSDLWAIKSLKNDGLTGGPMQDVIDAVKTNDGSWKQAHELDDGVFSAFYGAKKEAAVMRDIGPQNIDETSYVVKDKNGITQGEIDVIKNQDSFVEVKKTFDRSTAAGDFRKKLTAIQKSNTYSLDGSTYLWRAENINDRSRISSEIRRWEQKANNQWNADVDINVREDSTGTTLG